MRMMNKSYRWLLAALAVATLPLTRTASAVSATGGSVTTNNGYVIHTFTNIGTFTFAVADGGSVDALVVGGGGGGGSRNAGGGGAGGLIYTSSFPVVSASNYLVMVGAGGTGNTAYAGNNNGASGSNSVFASLIAFGGGYGGGAVAGGPGGSGGGGPAQNAAGGGATNGQGYAGGTGAGQWGGGGGGGAGGAGTNGAGVGNYGTGGGPGVTNSISGSAAWYAGGGGGGTYQGTVGVGGSGIGGLGGATGSPEGSGAAAGKGAPNTGSGGGGGGKGGNGGSGIVIVRYSSGDPTIGSLTSSNVTGTSATLNAYLSSTGATPTYVTMYWGTNDAGVVASNWANANAFPGAQVTGTLTTNLSGLADQTVYTYRFMASNAVGVCWTPATTFTTLSDFTQWKRSMPITFSGYNRLETLTNYPALVVFTNVPGFDYAQFLSGNADLRFTDASQSNELAYEVEKWDTNGNSFVWVKVPALVDANTAIYAFWGRVGQTAPAYTTNGATWANGYISVWHLAESNGAVYDSTSNGIALTASAGLARGVAGTVGSAYSFNGSNAFADAASRTALNPTQITVEAWARLGAWTNDWHMLVAKGWDNSTIVPYSLAVQPNSITNKVGFGTYSSGWKMAYSTTSVAAGNTYYLSGTYDGAAFSIYLNGMRDGVTNWVGVLPSDTRRMSIGAGADWGTPSSTNYFFNGMLDEVRLSSFARSSNWLWACWMTQGSNSAFTTQGAVTSLDGSPTIANAAPTGVATNAATLNGILVSTGLASSAVSVYWGPTDGGTNKAAWANTNSIGVQAVGAVSNLVSLDTDGLYFYRFHATNQYGEAWANRSVGFISGAVLIQATDPAAAEDASDPGTFTISRPLSTTNLDLAINYTIGGTATPGVDYATLPASVTLPAGVSTTNIIVTPVYEVLAEGDETVMLTLQSGSYAMGSPATATVTITDSELAHWYVTTNGVDTNTGKSWAQAYRTISNATAHAVAGDTVLISNGVYNVATNIFVTNSITVRGVGGWSNTVINGGGITRCFWISHAGAVVEGLTLSNGYAVAYAASGYPTNCGAGAFIVSGTLQNCLITRNRVAGGYPVGGGVYMDGGGRVQYCTFRENTASPANAWAGGGGVALSGGSLVQYCWFQGNVAGESGGAAVYLSNRGTAGGTVRNCVMVGNECTVDGWMLMSGAVTTDNASALVEHCTIVGNKGIGATTRNGGTIRNSILYFNIDIAGVSKDYRSYTAANFYKNCSTPFLTGNVADDPMFVNPGSGVPGTNYIAGDYHLQFGSPAIDAGMTLAAVTNDFEGTRRPLNGGTTNGLVYDMGAYEASFADSPLGCSISAGRAGGVVPMTNTFTAMVIGGASVTNIVYYRWDFGPGTTPQEGANKRIVTNVFDLGRYPISLSVSNSLGTVATNTVPVTIQAVGTTAYVATNGPSIFPYDTWDKAATNIQTAIDVADVAFTGGYTTPPPLVWVSNGSYAISAQIQMLRGVTLRSVGGRDVTVVRRATGFNKRGFYIMHSAAVLDGFTITGFNCVNDGGGDIGSGNGAGIMIPLGGAGTVQNCVISNTTAGGNSAVQIYGGTMSNCVIERNYAFSDLISIGNATIKDCIIRYNVNQAWGGAGVTFRNTGGIMRNCLFYGNVSTLNSSWGTIFMDSGLLENCTVVGNHNGGIYIRNGNGGATVRNCIVYGNSYSNFYDSGGGHLSYTCTDPLPVGGVTNIVADPMFINAGSGGYGTNFIAGDFHLRGMSPCRDAGLNQSWMSNGFDLVSQPRLVHDRVDLGVYEMPYQPGAIFTMR